VCVCDKVLAGDLCVCVCVINCWRVMGVCFGVTKCVCVCEFVCECVCVCLCLCVWHAWR
jgi:hypothetical protein